MTEYKPEHLAKEAERLLNEPILIHAMKDLKQEALEELSRADADNTTLVISWQQRALIADDILGQLRRYILAMPTE